MTRKHEQHAAPMLSRVIHNISEPYWHKLFKLRNLTCINPQFSRVDAIFALQVRKANPQSYY